MFNESQALVSRGFLVFKSNVYVLSIVIYIFAISCIAMQGIVMPYSYSKTITTRVHEIIDKEICGCVS